MYCAFYSSAAKARQGTGRARAGTKRTRRGQEEDSGDSEQEGQQDDATEGMADMCLSDGEAQETDMEVDAGPVMLPSSGRSRAHTISVDMSGNAKLSTNEYLRYICIYLHTHI